MPTTAPKLIVRLGSHSEKNYLHKTKQFLDGLIVGANLVQVTPGATASLLTRLAGEASRPNYYIDPMTYAFGTYIDHGALRKDLDWIKSNQKEKGSKKIIRAIKRSYDSLSKEFGHPFSSAAQQGRALVPADLSNHGELDESCLRVAEYQLNKVKRILQQDEEFARLVQNAPSPAAVFAHYFYVEPSMWEQWTETNIKLATATASQFRKAPVHAILCADASFLDRDDFLSTLKQKIPETGVSAIWLWFSTFDEQTADVKTLVAFRDLVRSLSEKIEVYNLHGGYFSLALSKYGMSGISHGVGYGEHKDVHPVIGATTPTVRYYLPDIHRRLGVPKIERGLDFVGARTPADFHNHVCDCVVCKGIVKDSLKQFSAFGDMHYSRPDSTKISQTPAAAKRCRFHFLLRRIKEVRSMQQTSLDDIVRQLDQSNKKWGPAPVMQKECGHLSTWIKALAPSE